MAEEPDPDTEIWGKDDPELDYVPRPGRPGPRASGGGRWIGFAIAGIVGVVLLGLAFMWLRAQDVAHMQAEMDRRRALEEQLRIERMEAERVKAVLLAKNAPPDVPVVLPPDEALRTIAIDAEALNKLGLHLLNDWDDPEGAIEKFRAAANLDPKYEANIELARKRRIQLDHTAPRPRPID